MHVTQRLLMAILTSTLCTSAFAHTIIADQWLGSPSPGGDDQPSTPDDLFGDSYNNYSGVAVSADETSVSWTPPKILYPGLQAGVVNLPFGITLAGISSLKISNVNVPADYSLNDSNGSPNLGLYARTLLFASDPGAVQPADEIGWFDTSYADYLDHEVAQVTLFADQQKNASTLTIGFGYQDDPGCGHETGQTASISVNGATYVSAANPCSNNAALTFKNGVLESKTGGWTETTVPLPASFWLMLGGLGGIGSLAGRKRAI